MREELWRAVTVRNYGRRNRSLSYRAGFNIGKGFITGFIFPARRAFYNLGKMTAHKKSGRHVNKLVTNLFLADNDHFFAALFADLVCNFVDNFFYGKVFECLFVSAFCLACMLFYNYLTFGMDIRCFFFRSRG